MDPAESRADVQRRPKAARGRGWAWIALTAAGLLWVATAVTFGFALVLAPIAAALSVVAWRRSPHDGVFWVGATLNASQMLGFAFILVGILTGDVGIGFE